MTKTLLGLATVCAAIGMESGCNRPAPTQTAAPTTEPSQTSASAPRTAVPLKVFPITLRLPKSWKLESLGSVTMLDGPAPGGDEEIALTLLPQITQEHLDLMLASERASTRGTFRRIELPNTPDIAGMKVFDRISHTYTHMGEVTRPSARPGVGDSELISWSRIFYVPHEDGFLPCSFSIDGLTPEQYNADKEFLHSILDSATLTPDPEIR